MAAMTKTDARVARNLVAAATLATAGRSSWDANAVGDVASWLAPATDRRVVCAAAWRTLRRQGRPFAANLVTAVLESVS